MNKINIILVLNIGYILGILIGLYIQKGIVLFLCVEILIYLVSIQIRKTRKYIKLIIPIQTAIIFFIIQITGIIVIQNKENKFNYTYTNHSSIQVVAIVESKGLEKEYGTEYIIKIKENNTKLKMRTNQTNLTVGDIIKVDGEYEVSPSYKNEGVFNYQNYLKKENIYGSIQPSNIVKISNKKSIKTLIKNISDSLKNKFRKNFTKQTAEYFNAIILGDKSELDKQIKENFQMGGISHLLAISGMHINFIVILVTFLIEKLTKDNRLKKKLTILILVLYATIIDFSPSAIRAIIMANMHILSILLLRSDSFPVNISLSSLILLIKNPYYIIDSGFLLSFVATISIVCIFKKITIKTFKNKLVQKLYESIMLSISANILILPIIINLFKKISLSTILIGIIVSPFIFIIDGIGLISLFLPSFILKIIQPVIEIFISVFDFISSIHFLTIYIKTLTIFQILLYYSVVFKYLIKPKRNILKKIINVLIISTLVLDITINLYKNINQNLEIYMIDVEQGDSTLIKTPIGRTILVDGGGSENYNVGENVLIPYLLNKKINKIDYLMISHFDTDHVRTDF